MAPVSLRCMTLASFVFVFLVPVALPSSHVEVGSRTVIPCDKTCGGNLTWSYPTTKQSVSKKVLLVLSCDQRSCTAGESYKNRVIKTGKSSVILNPVYFNDDGWYEAECDSEHLCEFSLVVLVSHPENATVGEKVVLPCYAHTDKQIPDDKVNIVWKKGDQDILHIENGITVVGDPASVSLDKYKEGDLSVTIPHVTMSDKGLYSCCHSKEQDPGKPDSFHLNVQARRDSFSRSSGSSLTLQLFGLISGTINFQPSADPAKEIQVCEVTGTSFSCSSHFSDRASVTNDTFVLHELTSQDSGTYTVKDQNETVGVYGVIVEGWLGKEKGTNAFWIPLGIVVAVVVVVVVIILVLYRKYCKRQAHPAPSEVIDLEPEVNRDLQARTSDQDSETMLSVEDTEEVDQIPPESSVGTFDDI